MTMKLEVMADIELLVIRASHWYMDSRFGWSIFPLTDIANFSRILSWNKFSDISTESLLFEVQRQ